ncbi:pyruvate dehydrogenase (acetyl-transferring) E1 component subunit alpha [Planctomonas sp. JC2975]|uniref:pyruvate dehydrogenase (acetyl-transferring) E1 component subunit alpha n=1 Tax=Planctomonas sp. JC2975 TaxID=2729626 RepID=UPI001472A206|nr:pyruvate dehydrogenase (acetyl-transferring) E1 component subunit alpha [Planctomonas sp. JC2975]NNC12477.1 pyruvate dehydrogenase (acetyl-transferring) E1 component subunit alpha [Planctomonas sp. JC2975]
MSATNDRFASSEGLSAATVQVLTEDGRFEPTDNAAEFLPYLETLTDDDYRRFYRDMVVVRRFDVEATNLQRQGQLALWPPSSGQEAAQVGSAYAAKPQDTIFPSYREHVVATIRGVDPLDIIRVMRGVTNGGWDPTDPKNGNVRIYTLVLGTQALHATGYAMGVKFDGNVGTGDPDVDQAVIVYFGDGASSEGDVSEALVFAGSFQTPEVFFLQNNQWAISVPVKTQSRSPLHLRAGGFGMPGYQVDGNDVLASYMVSAKQLDAARNGDGPSLIEAVTYRMGAHTTSDDPTRYRTSDEESHWRGRDPIARMRAFLAGRGIGDEWFASVDEEAADYAADIRRRTLEIAVPTAELIFDHVYSEPHADVVEQQAWLERYEKSFEADAAASTSAPSPASTTTASPAQASTQGASA